ncbi:MAG: divergent polysaccharide deacetylase family protein, partial [Campylobacterota bacterium]|nr:divergent polysaccharide deacetylase family protein [Campylobacterota bacterium]
MAKRKRKKSSSNIFLTYTAWGLAIVALTLSSLVGGYYLGYEDAKEDILKKSKSEKTKRLTMLQKLEDASSKKDKTSVNNRLKEVLKKESKTHSAAAHEYENATSLKPPKRVKREFKRISSKPKLAIIIDDVSVKSHVKAIKSLGIPLT